LQNLILLPLLRGVKFFKERNLTDEVLYKITRIAQHEFAKKDRVIFMQGSVASKLYVIIDGEVSINLKNQEFMGLKREKIQLIS
jgi:CRP-like cAMP-binding protein